MRFSAFAAVLILIFFVIFLIRSGVTQDPDFGWHIQAGTLIMKHGMSIKDHFSYSMSSYPFIDHEWLTNFLWSFIFNKWGIFPLLIGMSFLAIGSLFLQVIIGQKKWVSILIFLAGETFLDFVGLRTQIISWVFLSVLLCVLFQNRLWVKWRYGIPLLFFAWANLHGSFGIGLGVLGIVLIGRALEEKEQILEKILILGLSIAVTLINPFGIRLWWEFWMQLSDVQLHWSIAEWYPAIYFTNIAFWIYCLLSVFLIIRFKRHYTFTELFLYFFFLFAAMSSIRNIPLWVIISFTMTARGLLFLYQEASKHKYGSDRFRVAYIFFFFTAFVLFSPQLGGFFYDLYILKENPAFYPAAAVSYLHKHIPQQQIFSSYDWGGYLIWKLPEKKVFIDGRMPSWRWHANKKGESNYAFDEYKSVLTEKIPFVTFAEKYHISTLLVPISQMAPPETKFLGISIRKDSPLNFLVSSYKSFYLVVNQAKKAGWKEVYHDQTAIVFER